ncbi:unnamed protein product, partial [Mesorhabditis spiculigera]
MSLSSLFTGEIAGQPIETVVKTYEYFGAAVTNQNLGSWADILYHYKTPISHYKILNWTTTEHHWNRHELWNPHIRFGFAVSHEFKHFIFWVSGANDSKLVEWPLFEKQDYVLVSSLMLEAYEIFKEAALTTIRERTEEVCAAESCDYEFVFTGHSIGGCISQMLAVEAALKKHWSRLKISYLGFAPTRCGNVNYAALVQALFTNVYRYQWNNDALTNIPYDEVCNRYDPKALPVTEGHTSIYTSEDAIGIPCFYHAGKLLIGKWAADGKTREIWGNFPFEDMFVLPGEFVSTDLDHIGFDGNQDLLRFSELKSCASFDDEEPFQCHWGQWITTKPMRPHWVHRHPAEDAETAPLGKAPFGSCNVTENWCPLRTRCLIYKDAKPLNHEPSPWCRRDENASFNIDVVLPLLNGYTKYYRMNRTEVDRERWDSQDGKLALVAAVVPYMTQYSSEITRFPCSTIVVRRIVDFLRKYFAAKWGGMPFDVIMSPAHPIPRYLFEEYFNQTADEDWILTNYDPSRTRNLFEFAEPPINKQEWGTSRCFQYYILMSGGDARAAMVDSYISADFSTDVNSEEWLGPLKWVWGRAGAETSFQRLKVIWEKETGVTEPPQ